MGSKASVKATVVCEELNGAQMDSHLAASTEYLRFESSGACVGCALSLACEFFESAAKDDLILDIGCPHRPATVTFRSASIVEFERAPQAPDSLHQDPLARGAVFYRPEGDEGIFAAQLECRAQDASVCRQSLSLFRATAAREAPRRRPQRN